MQEVVLNEVEKLLFRSNISTKAQYYSLCFLSQFYLSHDNEEVARKLIELYFSFFKACIKKGEVDSRMMSALLMGVNRAYPYAKLESGKLAEHIDTIYRVVHIANFNIGLHALTLLFQVSQSGESTSDRFYSALYKKLIDSKLFSTTHQAMLLSLIYKALLHDPQVPRVKVFIKRLLQLALFMQPAFACGVLYLVSQLMGKKENLQSLILTAPRKESRIENVGSEVNDEKEETKFNVNSKPNKVTTRYNPLCRNPLYGGGEFCAYSELALLRLHFHPTVALYASHIIDGEIIKYSGDPLKDFTLIAFLDRFVFKNPKSTLEAGVSGAHPTFGRRQMYRPKGLKALSVTSDGFLGQPSTNIPVEELFMHTFLKRKYEHKSKSTPEDEDSDLESVQSDEFEEMLDKMAQNPEEEDDLDFLDDIQDSLKSKRNAKKSKTADEDEESDVGELDDSLDEDEDDFDEEGGEENDFDMNEEDHELLKDLDGEDDDDDDMVFDDDDTDESEPNVKIKKQKLKQSKDSHSLFASAEEFASILEDEGSAKRAPGSSNDFINQENSSLKQLAWEEKRDHWLNGYNKALGKGKIKNKNHGKRLDKRKSTSKPRGNIKKMKKIY